MSALVTTTHDGRLALLSSIIVLTEAAIADQATVLWLHECLSELGVERVH